MAIEAGKFDPVPAQFMQKVTVFINNEPVQSAAAEETFYETWIRFPSPARGGLEAPSMQRVVSSNQIAVRLRRDETSVQIDPSMTMVHNGQRYGIISINPIPSNERDEIELLVQYEKKAVLRTS